MNYGSSTGDRRREYKKRFSERYTKILFFNGNNGTLKKNDADICINRGGAAKIPNMNWYVRRLINPTQKIAKFKHKIAIGVGLDSEIFALNRAGKVTSTHNREYAPYRPKATRCRQAPIYTQIK